MRSFMGFLFLIGATSALAQSTTGPTFAEASMVEAQKAISSQPALAAGYEQLATALLRRARETSDASYIRQADEAAERALQLAPDDFESQRTEVFVRLAQHEFPAALEHAKALNKRLPDDVLTYGLLTVGNAELGNYAEAENAAQWMLNLRPGNLPALINTAYLRELFGDPNGAYQLLEVASQSTAPTETEERAWIMTRMAHMRLISGNADSADRLLQSALDDFPGYRAALAGLAEVRLAQKRYDEAIALLQQGQPIPARAASLYLLAEAFGLAGHRTEAVRAYQEFEARAKAESASKDNANRELVLYYVDYLKQPSQALALARQELGWRHDVYTLDCYAWALHANGQDLEARQQIESALAVGIRDARLFRHAGEIALRSGDFAAAQRYLQQAIDSNTPDSEQAKATLASLKERR
ncbi:MAG TPA: tetratricopeptide repeat protein [Terriglobales bacterium]|nr:tetratricopeptide repeat protein [Terriglobales bacterium]